MRETLAKSWGCRTSSVQDATRGVLPCLDGLTYRKPYLYISLRVRVSRKKVPNNPMPAHYIVKLNSLCNLNCCFCADSIEARGVPDFKYDALIKGLERTRQLHDSLIISGGEPTIYPNLLPFLHHAKKVCGYKRISLTTNGVMLSSQKNADALIHAGVDAFLVSFSTSHERMFDAIVKKEGSPHQQRAAQAQSQKRREHRGVPHRIGRGFHTALLDESRGIEHCRWEIGHCGFLCGSASLHQGSLRESKQTRLLFAVHREYAHLHRP